MPRPSVPDPHRWIVPAVVVVMGGLLWATGTAILAARPDPGTLTSRIAVARTDDGGALRVVVEGCDALSVRRVTVRDASGTVWEVEGRSPPSRANFVIGQTADPMTVTRVLDDPLAPDATYWVDVESDRVETLSFTLQSVPPVGVLHEGVEMTTEGFHSLVERQHCQAARRIPFAGSILAQVLLILAGAAFAVVAAGLTSREA